MDTIWNCRPRKKEQKYEIVLASRSNLKCILKGGRRLNHLLDPQKQGKNKHNTKKKGRNQEICKQLFQLNYFYFFLFCKKKNSPGLIMIRHLRL